MLPSQSLSLYIKYKDMIFAFVLRMKLQEAVFTQKVFDYPARWWQQNS
jgi:hypothetical protein